MGIIEWCLSIVYFATQVYDGYDSNAPILLEVCGFDIPDPITSSSNVIYIDFSVDILRQGSWFELNWIQVPIVNDDNGENIVKKRKYVGCISLGSVWTKKKEILFYSNSIPLEIVKMFVENKSN